MGDLTKDSQRLIEEGRRLRDDNRTGGRHRLAPSIGQGSKRIKRNNLIKRIRNVVIAVFTIFLAAGIAGAIFDGIGFFGVMAVLVATIVATAVFSSFPKVKTPKRADLTKGDVRTMVGRTELWLEHQRAALPAPAARIVEDMGVQLDALGLQLETVDPTHPAAQEVRKLVGDVLPETIDAYRRIPAHLRTEQRGGSTPDQQLTDSLGKISREIDHVTRQLAEGSLDDLAIKSRYLDYKYSGALDEGSGVPLPDFDQEKAKTR